MCIYILTVSRAVFVSMSLYRYIDYMETKCKTNLSLLWIEPEDGKNLSFSICITVSSVSIIVSNFAKWSIIRQLITLHSIKPSFQNFLKFIVCMFSEIILECIIQGL
jgi:hypothetical protein